METCLVDLRQQHASDDAQHDSLANILRGPSLQVQVLLMSLCDTGHLYTLAATAYAELMACALHATKSFAQSSHYQCSHHNYTEH